MPVGAVGFRFRARRRGTHRRSPGASEHPSYAHARPSIDLDAPENRHPERKDGQIGRGRYPQAIGRNLSPPPRLFAPSAHVRRFALLLSGIRPASARAAANRGSLGRSFAVQIQVANMASRRPTGCILRSPASRFLAMHYAAKPPASLSIAVSGPMKLPRMRAPDPTRLNRGRMAGVQGAQVFARRTLSQPLQTLPGSRSWERRTPVASTPVGMISMTIKIFSNGRDQR